MLRVPGFRVYGLGVLVAGSEIWCSGSYFFRMGCGSGDLC